MELGMHKISKIAALIGALLPASAIAHNIEGVVLNNSGKAVAGAKVEVEGVGRHTKTDKHMSYNFVVNDQKMSDVKNKKKTRL